MAFHRYFAPTVQEIRQGNYDLLDSNLELAEGLIPDLEAVKHPVNEFFDNSIIDSIIKEGFVDRLYK